MKRFSRTLLTVLLALTLALVCCVPAMAESATSTDKGSVTVTNPVTDRDYTLYRIFDVQYNETTGAQTYTVNAQWNGFITGAGSNYVTVDTNGNVTWKDGASASDFAKLAIEYAKGNNNVSSVASKTASEANLSDGKLIFANIPYGYYLVDSSVGALCSLDSTTPSASVQEKNGVPTLEKTAKTRDDNYGTENTGSIGQTVGFKLEVHAQPGAVNYVIHDTMSAGLTFKQITGVKKSVGGTVSTLNTPADYTLSTTDLDCTFEIDFSDDVCSSLGAGNLLIVEYEATINENAVIGTEGNENEATLSYGDNSDLETTPSKTKTYVYKFDLVKTDTAKKLLDGATFQLYRQANGGTPISFYKDGTTYRVATDAEIAATTNITTDITVTGGMVTITGLGGSNGLTGENAATSYYLEETVAPVGYNKLTDRQEVKIEKTNLDATIATEDNVKTWQSGGVQVINNTGSKLPSTGGIGTTMFYTLGGILVLAAIVLLTVNMRKKEKR